MGLQEREHQCVTPDDDFTVDAIYGGKVVRWHVRAGLTLLIPRKVLYRFFLDAGWAVREEEGLAAVRPASYRSHDDPEHPGVHSDPDFAPEVGGEGGGA